MHTIVPLDQQQPLIVQLKHHLAPMHFLALYSTSSPPPYLLHEPEGILSIPKLRGRFAQAHKPPLEERLHCRRVRMAASDYRRENECAVGPGEVQLIERTECARRVRNSGYHLWDWCQLRER